MNLPFYIFPVEFSTTGCGKVDEKLMAFETLSLVAELGHRH